MSLITTILDSQSCCTTSKNSSLKECYPACEHNHDTLYYRKQQIDSRFASIEVGEGSQTYFGSSIPVSGLGKNNDIYINTTTNTFYKKASGNWVVQYIITIPPPTLTPSLQQVTTVGNTTTDNLIVRTSAGLATSLTPQMLIFHHHIDSPSNNNWIRMDSENVGRLILPHTSTTERYIPVAVNGVYANSSGHITIPIPTPAGFNVANGSGVNQFTVAPSGQLRISGPGVSFNPSTNSVLIAGGGGGGDSYIFDSGLTLDNGTVSLGTSDYVNGMITKPTELAYLTDNNLFQRVIIVPGTLGLEINTTDFTRTIAINGTDNGTDNRLNLSRTFNNGAQSIIFGGPIDRMWVNDSINYKGLEYEDDYSINWTDHSLVTKKWVSDYVDEHITPIEFEYVSSSGGILNI